MPRGLVAPLSPNEEVTLRRVALGFSRLATLPLKHIDRLRQLGLVQGSGESLRLTVIGTQRYLALPRSYLFRDHEQPELLAPALKALSADPAPEEDG